MSISSSSAPLSPVNPPLASIVGGGLPGGFDFNRTGDGNVLAMRKNRFKEDGFYVWCGSPLYWEGTWWLFYARWPIEAGYDAWATHSEIALAHSESVDGPYLPSGKVIIPGKDADGGTRWDSAVAHNPCVVAHEGKIYLAYMGNDPNSAPDRTRHSGSPQAVWWKHRNAQRIGVAIADHPLGPWLRPTEPTIDIAPDGWDNLMVANPSLLQKRDKSWMLAYKGVTANETEFGARVSHGIAEAEHPAGPYRKVANIHPFESEQSTFPAEDPFLYYDAKAQKYRAIVKDMVGCFTGVRPSLANFESDDGYLWSKSDPVLAIANTLVWDDGRKEELERLERPQIAFDANGLPIALFVACKPFSEDQISYSLCLPIARIGTDESSLHVR